MIIVTKHRYWLRPFLGIWILSVVVAVLTRDWNWWWLGPLALILAEVRLLAASYRVDFQAEISDKELTVVADNRKVKLDLEKISGLKLRPRKLLSPILRLESWESEDDFIEIPVALISELELLALVKNIKLANNQVVLARDLEGLVKSNKWKLSSRIKYFWGEKAVVLFTAFVVGALGVVLKVW